VAWMAVWPEKNKLKWRLWWVAIPFGPKSFKKPFSGDPGKSLRFREWFHAISAFQNQVLRQHVSIEQRGRALPRSDESKKNYVVE